MVTVLGLIGDWNGQGCFDASDDRAVSGSVREGAGCGGAGAGWANLGDLTGFVGRKSAQSGSWTEEIDSERANTPWQSIVWNSESCAEPTVPDSTTLVVRIRAADFPADLEAQPYVEVVSGEPLVGVAGRYLQVQARFVSSDDVVAAPTPVLCDVTVQAGCTAD